jgi:staphylococcal nuclease domain-containing protein 1
VRGACSRAPRQPWAFEAREFLRTRLVGKEVSFTTTHALPPSSSGTDEAPVARDIGAAELAGRDVAAEVLKAGWARVKDVKREPADDDARKLEAEAEARAAGLGIWNPHGQKVPRAPGVRSRRC